MGSIHFESRSNEWGTPQALFDKLNSEFDFTLDPCATDENAKCKRHFTVKDNGLAKSWEGERVFMNPPYGRQIRHWIKKAFEEKGATVVCLIPARTDTRYWHDYCMQADEIRLIKVRLKFGDSKNSAPFPSAIVIFKERTGSSIFRSVNS